MPEQDRSRKAERRDIFDEEYRKAIRWIESLPQNQSGADKSWVWQAMKQAEEHFARAKRRRIQE